jgi:diazepam-binding inhibitor (GABA receptor modulating acyl-CoA-binding protein)
MSGIEDKFIKATKDIKQINKLDNKSLLKLYGYYKQSTIGDCNIECPTFWDAKGQAKWISWNENKGKSKEKAMKYYSRFVKKILKENGIETETEVETETETEIEKE